MDWQVPNSLVESPGSDTSGLFHLVPPTPNDHALNNTQTFQLPNGYPQPQAQLGDGDQPNVHSTGYHLRPDRSNPYLKSSRSFSTGSTESDYSNYSQNPNISHHSHQNHQGYANRVWSTVGSDSGSTSFTEFGDHVPLPNGQGLSIDPKLFRAKESGFTSGRRGKKGLLNGNQLNGGEMGDEDGRGGVGGGIVGGEEEGEEEEGLKTAKPFPKRGPKSPSAKNKGEKKKVSHARKQGPEHIPRPRNAFILFRKHVVDSKLIPPSVEMRHQNVSVIVAKMWSEASPEQKAEFNELAKIEKEEHMKKYPGYRYQPVYRRTNVIRRRVRKDDAEEEKCKSVAELLMRGKSGEALEQEIKEKIRKEKKNQLSSGANELSKGALRALRAQARHQSTPSIDWSDYSPPPPGDRETTQETSRATSLETDHMPFKPDSHFQQSDQGRMGLGMSLGEELLRARAEVNGYNEIGGEEGYEPYFEGYQWMSGNHGNTEGKEPEQTYAYPQDEMSSNQYSYPQPFFRPTPTDLPVPADFYTFDQALPFSPSATTTTFNFGSNRSHNQAHPHGLPLNHISNSHAGLSLDTDFSSLINPEEMTLGMPYPSPTSGLYGGNGTLRLGPVPMSARWDRGNHLLPPSSEIPLEGLGFEGLGMESSLMGRLDDDVLLADFGAALAQVDEAW